MRMMVGSLGMVFLLAPLTVLAQNKVVVIPLFGNDAKPLKNIVTVAKSNGMFTDPVAAVNSISDASASNPYLVVIGPGVYTITATLQMKEYVDIAGSGENVTKVTGAISAYTQASSAIISGAGHCALTSLTVENTGGCQFSIGLYNKSASPVIRHVSATASGGDYNYGVWNFSSSPTMTNITASASGGDFNYGVYNHHSSSPIMTNITASASGGADGNYGVGNFNSSPVIRRSTLDAANYGLYSYTSITTVSQSTIKNGVRTEMDGKNTCVACDNGSGVALTGDCTEPTP